MTVRFDSTKRVALSLVSLVAAFCLVLTATAGAGSRRSRGVPDWGNPGGCYYGANSPRDEVDADRGT